VTPPAGCHRNRAAIRGVRSQPRTHTVIDPCWQVRVRKIARHSGNSRVLSPCGRLAGAGVRRDSNGTVTRPGPRRIRVPLPFSRHILALKRMGHVVAAHGTSRGTADANEASVVSQPAEPAAPRRHRHASFPLHSPSRTRHLVRRSASCRFPVGSLRRSWGSPLFT
jgi:hypothetical protein